MAFETVDFSSFNMTFEFLLEDDLQGAKWCRRVLIVRFHGDFGYGSGGNETGAFMEAIVEAGIRSWDVDGVIVDLRDVTYEWGDMMELVLSAGDESRVEAAFVVGPKCEAAIGTLMHGLNSPRKSAIEFEYIFDDIDAAVDYLRSYVPKYDDPV